MLADSPLACIRCARATLEGGASWVAESPAHVPDAPRVLLRGVPGQVELRCPVLGRGAVGVISYRRTDPLIRVDLAARPEAEPQDRFPGY